MSARVVVVGGGLAGLAAAIEVADAGAAVHVFERAPRLGGATWSFTRDGVTYDNGQHVFMRCCTEYLSFLERIGSRGKVTLQPRLDVPVLRPGGPDARLRRVALPAPAHLGPALVRYRHLRPSERLHAVRTAMALRRLSPGDARLDDETFGAWLAGRGASSAEVAALWNLVCLPTVNLDANEASLRLAVKVFRTGLLDTAGGADLGWTNVPLRELHGDAAVGVLARRGAVVRTGAAVKAVRQDGTRPTVAVDGEVVEADAVILAVPHTEVDGLLPERSFEHQAQVAGLGLSPIVNVHLVYDRRVMHEPFAAALDSPVQFVFDRTVPSGVAAGRQCLAVSLSGADRYLPMSRQELVTLFTAELARLFPAARTATVVESMVTREVDATFRGTPGSQRLRPGVATRLPGVHLAGAWTDTGWPATMEGAVRSGRAAALAALAALAHLASSTEGAAR